MFNSTRSIATLVLAFVCILGGIYLLTFHSNGEALGPGLSSRRGEAMRLLHERGLLTPELQQKLEKLSIF